MSDASMMEFPWRTCCIKTYKKYTSALHWGFYSEINEDDIGGVGLLQEVLVAQAAHTLCKWAQGGVKAHRQMSQCCHMLRWAGELFPSSHVGSKHLICDELISTQSQFATHLAKGYRGGGGDWFCLPVVISSIWWMLKKKIHTIPLKCSIFRAAEESRAGIKTRLRTILCWCHLGPIWQIRSRWENGHVLHRPCPIKASRRFLLTPTWLL